MCRAMGSGVIVLGLYAVLWGKNKEMEIINDHQFEENNYNKAEKGHFEKP